MLNAMEPGTYIQPHKHESPDKFEIFLALRGRFAVFTFDDAGNILHYCILDPKQGIYGVEIPERTYHTLISLETGVGSLRNKSRPPLYTSNCQRFCPLGSCRRQPGSGKLHAIIIKQNRPLKAVNLIIMSTQNHQYQKEHGISPSEMMKRTLFRNH